MRYLVIFFVSAVCASFSKGGHAMKRIALDSAVIGKYHAGYGDFGTHLILKTDKTFEYTDYWHSDVIMENEEVGRLKIIQGWYSVRDNVVSLTPKTLTRKKVFQTKEIILDSVPYYKSDTTFIAPHFNIVKWNKNVYLLSEKSAENDFIEFANNYNSGSEPGFLSTYLAKRWETKRHEKINLSQIPKKWQGYFLDSVLSVRVKGVDEAYQFNNFNEHRYYRFEIDKGKQSGVKEGMAFYFGNNSLRILKANKTSAKGIFELFPSQSLPFKIGDVLITWNEVDNGKFEKRFQHPTYKRFNKK